MEVGDPAYDLRIKISESDGAYEIEAKLFHAGQDQDSNPLKTIVESNVIKENVATRVSHIVSSMSDMRK